MKHDRAHFDRYASERKKYQARIKRDRWGMLFDEFIAWGWHPVKVDPRTGAPAGHKPGVWVMRYTGFDHDEPLAFAARVKTVTVKSRAFGRGE